MFLITCLAIGALVICLALFFDYIGKNPQLLEDEPKPELKYDSDNIQRFINERWTLQAQIRECSDLRTMEVLYWDIEQLDIQYRDVVPYNLHCQHINELYEAHTRYALQLNTKLKVSKAS